jgi:hypothetical protein
MIGHFDIPDPAEYLWTLREPGEIFERTFSKLPPHKEVIIIGEYIFECFKSNQSLQIWADSIR